MAMKSTPAIKPRSPQTYLGLDVGDVRIGVARVNSIARLPSPIEVIKNDQQVFDKIKNVAQQEGAQMVVVGLPRNLDGQETEQSAKIRQFAEQLGSSTSLEIVFTDESLSTKRAENMIKEQGLPPDQLDAIAACFILEEFINHQEN